MGYSIKPSSIGKYDSAGKIEGSVTMSISNEPVAASSEKIAQDRAKQMHEGAVGVHGRDDDEPQMMVAAGISDGIHTSSKQKRTCNDDDSDASLATAALNDHRMLRGESSQTSPHAPLLEKLAAMAELQQAKHLEEEVTRALKSKEELKLGSAAAGVSSEIDGTNNEGLGETSALISSEETKRKALVIDLAATASSGEIEGKSLVITPASSKGSSSSLASKIIDETNTRNASKVEDTGFSCNMIDDKSDTSFVVARPKHDDNEISKPIGTKPHDPTPAIGNEHKAHSNAAIQHHAAPSTRHQRPRIATAAAASPDLRLHHGRQYYSPHNPYGPQRAWYPPPYHHQYHTYNRPHPQYMVHLSAHNPHEHYPPCAYHPNHAHNVHHYAMRYSSSPDPRYAVKKEAATAKHIRAKKEPIPLACSTNGQRHVQHVTSTLPKEEVKDGQTLSSTDDSATNEKQEYELEESGTTNLAPLLPDMHQSSSKLGSTICNAEKHVEDHIDRYATANNAPKSSKPCISSSSAASAARAQSNTPIAALADDRGNHRAADIASLKTSDENNYQDVNRLKLPPEMRTFREIGGKDKHNGGERKEETHNLVEDHMSVYITPSPSVDDSHTEKKARKPKSGHGPGEKSKGERQAGKKSTVQEPVGGSMELKSDAFLHLTERQSVHPNASTDTANGREAGHQLYNSSHYPQIYHHHGYQRPTYPGPHVYPPTQNGYYRHQQHHVQKRYWRPHHAASHRTPQAAHPSPHPTKRTKSEQRPQTALPSPHLAKKKKKSELRDNATPMVTSLYSPMHPPPRATRYNYPVHMPHPYPHCAYPCHHYNGNAPPGSAGTEVVSDTKPQHVVPSNQAANSAGETLIASGKEVPLMESVLSIENEPTSPSTNSINDNTSKKLLPQPSRILYETPSHMPLELRSIMPLLQKTAKGRCIHIHGTLLQTVLNCYGMLNCHSHNNHSATSNVTNAHHTERHRVLPQFNELVNFPEYLNRKSPNKKKRRRMRKRKSDASDSSASSAPDADNCDEGGSGCAGRNRHCVMCGTRCFFDVSQNDAVISAQLNIGGGSGGDNVGDESVERVTSTSSLGKHETEQKYQQCQHECHRSYTIPRQNKGLCTSCDIKVWLFAPSSTSQHNKASNDPSQTTVTGEPATASTSATIATIKWCKGCKNFRHWPYAFGITKSRATKCTRCRDRQRQKYASTKRRMESKMSSCLS